MASVEEILECSTGSRMNSDDEDSDFEVISTARRKNTVYINDEEIEVLNSKYPLIDNHAGIVEVEDEVPKEDDGDGGGGEEEDEEEEEEEEEPLCPICLDNLPNQTEDSHRTTRSKQLLARTTCQHYYHYFCIKSWSEKANTCPQCRSTFNAIETLSMGNVIETERVEDKKFPVEIDESDFILPMEDGYDADYLPLSHSSYLQSHAYPICCLCDQISTSSSGYALCADCGGAFHLGCLGIMGSGAMNWNCPMCDSQQTQETITAAAPRARRSRGRRTGTYSETSSHVTANRRSNGGSRYVQSLREEIRNNRYTELGIEPAPIRRTTGRRRLNRRLGYEETISNTMEPDYTAIVDANKRYEAAQIRERQSREPLSEEKKAWKLLDHVQNGSPLSRNNSRLSTPIPLDAHSSSSSSSSTVPAVPSLRGERKFKRPKRSLHKHDQMQNNINTHPQIHSNIQSHLMNNQKTVVANLITDMKNNPKRQPNISITSDINENGSSLPFVPQTNGSVDLHLLKQPLPPPSNPPPGFLAKDQLINGTNSSDSPSGSSSLSPVTSGVDDNMLGMADYDSTPKLTVEALERHDSGEISMGLSPIGSSSQKIKRSTSDKLNYVQKMFIQKLLIHDKLKEYKSKYSITSDLYTNINKNVSRQVYKLVLRDNNLVNWMNKTIELLERYETSHNQISPFLKNLDDQDEITKRDDFIRLYHIRIEAMIDLELNNTGVI